MTLARIGHGSRLRRPDRGQAGLTLVELMVAMLLSSIAIAATLGIGYSMLNGYREQRRVEVVQRAARVSLEMLSSAVRGASPGVASGDIVDLVGCNDFGALAVTNRTDAPDELEVIYGSGGVITSLRAPYTESADELVVLESAGLAPGDLVLVTNFEKGHLVEIGDITGHAEGYAIDVTPANATACGTGTFPDSGYAAGSLVVRARLARFFVEETVVGPTLMLDPDGAGDAAAEPLAEGIEDLQIAVATDVDGDGLLREDGTTADEYFYNVPGDSDPPDLSVTPPRALRITVTARTSFEISSQPVSYRPPAEDRDGADAPDPYRRRTFAVTVEIRNLRGSL